jgi:predicted CoA-substrate-specific enzyme activase
MDANKTVTELSCHGRGAHFLHPATRTIIDVGGQDSKVLRIDRNGDMVDFAMNDKCAAGTGRFLEVMSHALEIPLEEIGNFSLRSSNPLRMSSTCTVFAETEVISLLAAKQKKEDIAAGLHSAIARRVGNMTKSFAIENDVVFVGGVAKNPGVRKALEEFLGIRFAPISHDPQIVGALGAALFAKDFFEGRREL